MGRFASKTIAMNSDFKVQRLSTARQPHLEKSINDTVRNYIRWFEMMLE